jgi:predicted RNA binding protein YcfA (HicA-like mRNA interferase family)
MLKLGVFSGEEVCGILEAVGFRRVRQQGIHIVM